MPVGDLGNLELGEMLFVFKVVGSMVETRRLSLQPSAGPYRFASIINEVSVGQAWLRMQHDRAASDSFLALRRTCMRAFQFCAIQPVMMCTRLLRRGGEQFILLEGEGSVGPWKWRGDPIPCRIGQRHVAR